LIVKREAEAAGNLDPECLAGRSLRRRLARSAAFEYRIASINEAREL
jgi:hypothetical protein